jgi:translation initiation factor IF-3
MDPTNKRNKRIREYMHEISLKELSVRFKGLDNKRASLAAHVLEKVLATHYDDFKYVAPKGIPRKEGGPTSMHIPSGT